MSTTKRLGIAAAWLALAGSAPAWGVDGKPDVKIAGGDVWFDEFYSAGAATPTPAVAASPSRGAAAPSVAGQHPHKRASAADGTRARSHHHRLARTR